MIEHGAVDLHWILLTYFVFAFIKYTYTLSHPIWWRNYSIFAWACGRPLFSSRYMARESVFTLVQREHSWCSPWGMRGELKKQLAVQHGLMRREGKSEIPFLIHRLRFSSLSFHTCVCPVSSESTPVPSHAADRGAEAQEPVQELSVPSLQVLSLRHSPWPCGLGVQSDSKTQHFSGCLKPSLLPFPIQRMYT